MGDESKLQRGSSQDIVYVMSDYRKFCEMFVWFIKERATKGNIFRQWCGGDVVVLCQGTGMKKVVAHRSICRLNNVLGVKENMLIGNWAGLGNIDKREGKNKWETCDGQHTIQDTIRHHTCAS